MGDVSRAGPAADPLEAGLWRRQREGLAAWVDRASPLVFVMPAGLVVLAFSLFPLIVSLYRPLARFKFVRGGISLEFVGFANYTKLLVGSQQFHLLGKF